MKRESLKKAPVTSFTVNKSVNFRDDYDVPSMMDEILQKGRILEPVWVRKEDGVVLKGNRRVAAGQELLKNPLLAPEIRKALENVDVFYISDMTEREVTEAVLDHGSQKPLSRVETVKAVWRLQRQMYSERDIITMMYQLLARFTGNTRKAYEAQQITSGELRDKFLQKWLHGTVGNYIMAAGQMGEFIKNQFILTETAADRALTDDEKTQLKLKTSRDRINDLSSAKKEDKEKGAGWTPENGGVKFNAKIEEFVTEDKNGKTPANKNRPTAEQIEQTADSMQSGMRIAFLQCAGKLPEGEKSKLDALDTEYHRRDQIFAALRVDVERVESPEVKRLIDAILGGTNVDVSGALLPFVGAAVANAG